jgi:hypothetical protein
MSVRAPAGFVGMLLLIVAVERAIDASDLDTAGGATLAWRIGKRAAQTDAVRAEILCLGDSLVKHGVQPKLIEAKTGRPGLNLALPSAQPPATYFMLRQAQDAGARPRVVIVDFAHDMLAGGPRYSDRNWPELAGFRDAAGLALTARDADLFANWLVAYVSPSVRSRFEIRQSIAALLRGEEAPHRPSNRALARNWAMNDGGHLESGNRGNAAILSADDARRLFADRWWCHTVNRAYARGVFQLATARGARVLWLMPPVAPALQARREASGADDKFTQFAQAMQIEFPSIVVVDARKSRYSADEFVDPIHLNRRGAEALSEDLAEIIKSRYEQAPNERWIPLPTFRERLVALPLEEFKDSRIAVGRKSGARQ